MNEKHKKIYTIIYIVTLLYSLFGLSQFGGGPCNSGLVFIFFAPIIIIIARIQYWIFKKITNQSTQYVELFRILSIICCLFWGYWTFFFAKDNVQTAILYLCPFLILNFVTTVLIFKNGK